MLRFVTIAALLLPVMAMASPYREPICVTGPSSAAELRVEVAATAEVRRRGLMGRDRLPSDAGMLFRFPKQRPASAVFWMYRVRIPLDIAYLDDHGKILTIRSMPPCEHANALECPRYKAGVPHWAALETNRGFFESRGIRVGDRVLLSECPAREELR